MALKDFVRTIKKSALLAHLKGVDEATAKWRKDLLDAVVTKDELVIQMEQYQSHDDLADRDLDEQHPSTAISVDVSNFGGLLTSSATDVQLALDEIDDIVLPTEDENAIHDNVAAEISAITAKTVLVGGDYFLIEDSESSDDKKSVILTDLVSSIESIGIGGTDENAIHDNVPDEIHQIASKTPTFEDEFVIEDSEDSWNKKSIGLGEIPIGCLGWKIEIDFDESEGYIENDYIVGNGGDHFEYENGVGPEGNQSGCPIMVYRTPTIGGVPSESEAAAKFTVPTNAALLYLKKKINKAVGVLDVYFRMDMENPTNDSTRNAGLFIIDEEEMEWIFGGPQYPEIPPGYPEYVNFRTQLVFGGYGGYEGHAEHSWFWQKPYYAIDPDPDPDLSNTYSYESITNNQESYYYHIRLNFTDNTIHSSIWSGDLEDEPGSFMYDGTPGVSFSITDSLLQIIITQGDGLLTSWKETYFYNLYIYYSPDEDNICGPLTSTSSIGLEGIAEWLIENISHPNLLGLESNDHPQYIKRGEIAQNGFYTKREDIDLTLTGAGVFGIEPLTSSSYYYIDDEEYILDSKKTIDISTAEGLWIVYLTKDGIAATNSPTDEDINFIIRRYCIVAYVYWDDTNSKGKILDALHGRYITPDSHLWISRNVDCRCYSGMSLVDMEIDNDGTEDADAQFGVSEGVFDSQDLIYELDAVDSTTGLEIWYLDGSNWRWTTTPGFSVIITENDKIAYNDGGTQVESTGGFVCCHVLATNIIGDGTDTPQYIAIQGQDEYGSVANAMKGAKTELDGLKDLGFPIKSYVRVATVVFETNCINSVGARIVSNFSGLGTQHNYIDWIKEGRLDSTSFTGTMWIDLTDGQETSLHTHPAGSDSTAIHDNVDGEIQAVAAKSPPVGADIVLIEDSEASWAKKQVTLTDLVSLAEGTTDHGALDGLEDDDHTQYVLRNQWLANGFVDPAESTLTWSDGDMELTIDKVAANFRYYHDGTLYTVTDAQSKEITDDEGLWCFYFNGATLDAVLNPTDTQIEGIIEDECIVAFVYWNATGGDGRLFDERHGYTMSPMTHHYLHDVLHAQYDTGMTPTDVLADQTGDLDTHAQFGLTEGKFYDEDYKHTCSEVASNVGLEIYYFDGTDLRWTTNAGFSVLTTGSGRLAYNNSGAQAEIGDNKFVLCHVFGTNIKTDAGADKACIAIQGQAEYDTLTLARAGANTEINALYTGDLPMPELVPVATFIFQTKTSYGNAVNARIRKTDTGDDYVDWRGANLIGSGGASASDHGMLAGLTDDDHTQYLLVDGTRGLSGDWDAGTFEIRANTFESDVAAGTAPLTIASNTLVTNLNADLLDGNEATAFAAADHDHDLDYLPIPDPKPAKGDILSWGTDTVAAAATGVVTEHYVLAYSGEITAGNFPEFSSVFAPPPDYVLVDSRYSPADFAEDTHEHSIGDLILDNCIEMTVKNSTGSTINAASLCYISGTSSGTPLITKTDADAEATSKGLLVLTSEGIINGDTGGAAVYGIVGGLSGLTAGAIQYISTSPGAMTETAPSGSGDIVRIVGYALDSTTMFFDPSKTYIELV